MEITEPILEVNLLSDSEEVTINSDQQIELIVKALSSRTRRRILHDIRQEPSDVSKIASDLSMTEANISAQIKKLENAGLIICDYASGHHGVRKISRVRYDFLRIKF